MGIYGILWVLYATVNIYILSISEQI